MTDEELIDRAIAAYVRRCKRLSLDADQPDIQHCKVRQDRVTLADAQHNIIAVYKISKNGTMRSVPLKILRLMNAQDTEEYNQVAEVWQRLFKC